MKNLDKRSSELLNKYLNQQLKKAAQLSRRLKFNSWLLDDYDAVSVAAIKFWEVVQKHGDKEDADFLKIVTVSIRNALFSLIRSAKRRDVRFRDSSFNSHWDDASADEDDDEEEEEDGDRETAEQPAEDGDTATDDFNTGDDEGDEEFWHPVKGFAKRSYDDERKRKFVDPDLCLDSRVEFLNDADSRDHRARTALTLHAIFTAENLVLFNRHIPENRRGRVSADLLLTPVERFVISTYGAGCPAKQVLQMPEGKNYNLRDANDVSNTFQRAYVKMWKILKGLGYHYIDIGGAFRGESLDENEFHIAFVSQEIRDMHARAFCIALHDLYASVAIAKE
ncbi:MAG: hypothetical protein LBS59_08785 [Puniceicoccales bacterium]|jgi:hypothetical protein|nr:hypothetical protein [Puniceicoccales bacterium]